MSFITRETQENNFEQYKQLVREASRLNSQIASWQGTFDSLRASVDVEKQGELDTKRTQFIAALRTSLGI